MINQVTTNHCHEQKCPVISSCDCTSNANTKKISETEFYFELRNVKAIQHI